MFEAENKELLALIDIKQWIFILNRFSEVLGIDIYTVDRNGKLITRPQHSPKIWELISKAKDPSWFKFQVPADIIQSLIRKSQQTNAPVEETANLGFSHALIPISNESSGVLGYLVVGPLLLGSRKSEAELEKVASEQEWDSLELQGAYQEVKLFSFIGMKAMLDLLSGVCNYLVQPTVSKGKREEVLSEFTSSWRKDLAVHSEELNNFFSTFLDLALQATNADSGSVMVLEPRSKTLRICVSHGLKEDVVKRAELKMGEGIAGWVAEHNQSLLIEPESEVKPPLRDRLKRREIDSSIVMPLARQNQVLGVLNINSHNKANRLKTQSLDLLNQLAKLTMVIL